MMLYTHTELVHPLPLSLQGCTVRLITHRRMEKLSSHCCYIQYKLPMIPTLTGMLIIIIFWTVFFSTVQQYVLAENRQYEHVTSKKTKSQTSVVSPVYSSFQPMFLLDIINNSYCSPERFIKRSQFTCCPLNLIYIYRLLKMQQNKTSWSAQWSEHLNKSLLVELLPKMSHRGKKPIILKGHSV